jgi:hypothetical protein
LGLSRIGAVQIPIRRSDFRSSISLQFADYYFEAHFDYPIANYPNFDIALQISILRVEETQENAHRHVFAITAVSR